MAGQQTATEAKTNAAINKCLRAIKGMFAC
jgi:hypothetical protein